MTYRFFTTLRCTFLAAGLAVSSAQAHHGPPHQEEDEFLSPPCRDSIQAPGRISLLDLLPALLLPCLVAGCMMLLASADPAERAES